MKILILCLENFKLIFCEEKKKVRIRSPHLDDNAKKVASAEVVVHMRRANKFTTVLNETTKKSKENENIRGLVFDYMQNVSLPKIPVQEIFYLRQLTVNVLCVYKTKTNLAHYYIYHEGHAHMGPDEVASFLTDYIKKTCSGNS